AVDVTSRVRFEFLVSDGQGGQASDSVEFTILAGHTEPADPQVSIPAVSRELVEIVAARDGTQDWSYSWVQVSGPGVTLQTPESSTLLFRAPDVRAETDLGFSLARTSTNGEETEQFTVRVSPQSSLILPAVVAGPSTAEQGSFVGIAVLNPLDEVDHLHVAGRDATGQLLGGQAELPIGGQAVTSFLVSEVTDSPGVVQSIALSSDHNPAQAFFLFGTRQLNRLDGVGQVLDEGVDLAIPLPDGAGKTGSLWILNPDTEWATTYQVDLQSFDGVVAGGQGVLAPGGTVTIPLAGFLASRSDSVGLYLRVTSQRSIRCLATLASASAWISLSGRAGQARETLVAPHFFFDDQGGDTKISLVNLGIKPLQGTVEALNDEGDSLGTLDFAVDGNGVFEEPVSSMFDAAAVQDGPVTGYLLIHLKASGEEAATEWPSVTGAVSFATAGAEAWATLPLLTEGRFESTVMHVTQSPEARLFMGMALLNLGDSPGIVRIDAISGEGKPMATSSFLIGSKQRRVGLLNEDPFFGPGFSQVGGHLRIFSDVPLLVYSLVGDYAGEYLAAVESQRLKR
ncbi:MAG: hypothetical protein JSU96_12760, partial [Acidobacteriota bacterium]